MFAEYLSPLKSGGLAVGKVSFCKDIVLSCVRAVLICSSKWVGPEQISAA